MPRKLLVLLVGMIVISGAIALCRAEDQGAPSAPSPSQGDDLGQQVQMLYNTLVMEQLLPTAHAATPGAQLAHLGTYLRIVSTQRDLVKNRADQYEAVMASQIEEQRGLKKQIQTLQEQAVQEKSAHHKQIQELQGALTALQGTTSHQETQGTP